MSSARLLLVLILLAAGCLSGCASSAARQQAVVPPLEKTFRVSGYVLDSVSRKPVAGVFVRGNYFGRPRTDSRGYFVLHLPVSQRTPTAQIIVRTALYEGRAVISADTAVEMTILLRRNKRQLPAADNCAAIADSLRMNPYAAQVLALPGFSTAFFIENKSSHTTDTIKAIIINREVMNLDWSNYWVGIYAAKNPLQAPQHNLAEQCGIAVDKLAAGPQYFDVKSANILVPPGGFIIELMLVTGCDKCPSWTAPQFNHSPTGPLLYPPCTLAEAHNWLFEYGPKISMRLLTPAENPVPLYHQGIQVELVGRK